MQTQDPSPVPNPFRDVPNRTRHKIHLAGGCQFARWRYSLQDFDHHEHLTRDIRRVTCGLCLRKIHRFGLQSYPAAPGENLITEVEGSVTTRASALDVVVEYRCPYCGQAGSCCMRRADIEAAGEEGHTERRFGCECSRGEFLVTVRGGSAG